MIHCGITASPPSIRVSLCASLCGRTPKPKPRWSALRRSASPCRHGCEPLHSPSGLHRRAHPTLLLLRPHVVQTKSTLHTDRLRESPSHVGPVGLLRNLLSRVLLQPEDYLCFDLSRWLWSIAELRKCEDSAIWAKRYINDTRRCIRLLWFSAL